MLYMAGKPADRNRKFSNQGMVTMNFDLGYGVLGIDAHQMLKVLEA